MSEQLFLVSEWIVLLVLLVVLGGATLLGLALGRRARSSRKGDESPEESQLSTVLGGVLGLLALLLAFAFAMSADRFDSRRRLVVDEANAIGTFALRAQMLPPPLRGRVLAATRDYVNDDVAFYAARASPAEIERADQRMRAAQGELWSSALQYAAADPHSILGGLLLQSLNEVIDLHDSRRAALDNRVPQGVLATLVVISILSAGLLGFAGGLGPRRDRLPVMLASMLMMLVLLLIIDLGRPRRGLITSNEAAILRLQHSLSVDAAPSGQ